MGVTFTIGGVSFQLGFLYSWEGYHIGVLASVLADPKKLVRLGET